MQENLDTGAIISFWFKWQIKTDKGERKLTNFEMEACTV